LTSKGGVVFTAGHTIHTPRALVEEILGKIKLHGNILVMFNIEFVVSLVYTCNIDPKTITFYSDSEDKTEFAKNLGVKYITTLGTDMKFDVVIGNPPYNDSVGSNRLESKNTNNSNLYLDFITKSFKLCPNGTVSLIVPAAWMQNEKIKNQVLAAGLDTVMSVPAEHFPGVGIRSGISMFKTSAGYTGDISILIGKTVYNISRSGTLSFDDPAKFNILSKLVGSATLDSKLKYGPYKIAKGSKGSLSRLLDMDNSFSEPASAKHKTKVLIYAGGNRDPERFLFSSYNDTSNKYGLAIPSASDKHILGAVRLVEPGVGVSDRLKVIYFDKKSQALNAQSYLNSKLIKFVIKTTKHNDTVNTNKNSFGNIPLIDFNKGYTDNEIYNLFSLTKEEIDYIESNS
jgi:site-specific DNA-methyltransferase (adenine-specific)